MPLQPLTPPETSLLATAVDLINKVRPLATRSATRVCDATVSCALLTSKGRVFTGVNLTHFTGGPCAEHVAIGNANASGVTNAASIPKTRSSTTTTTPEQITTIVAVVAAKSATIPARVISPCGKCRQILWDYHPGVRVIVLEPWGVVGGEKVSGEKVGGQENWDGDGERQRGSHLGDGGGMGRLGSVGMRELLPWAYNWVALDEAEEDGGDGEGFVEEGEDLSRKSAP